MRNIEQPLAVDAAVGQHEIQFGIKAANDGNGGDDSGNPTVNQDAGIGNREDEEIGESALDPATRVERDAQRDRVDGTECQQELRRALATMCVHEHGTRG
ncbi:MAG: hypothetical protein U5O39_16525 [Gammaproteobacteria bacterium]|nr:hypothetical protein [Gammaproteobacteria bacterium]